jgi:hypothetical protein
MPNVYAALFNGTDEYITVQNALSELNNQAQVSFTFWLRPAVQGGRGYIFSRYAGSERQVAIARNGTELEVYIPATGTGVEAVITTDTALTNNVWQHVAVVLALGSVNPVSIYVNGVLRTTSTVGTLPTALRASTSTTARLAALDDLSLPYSGYLAEFAIYRMAFTIPQVNLLRSNGSPPPQASLAMWPNAVMHYRFNPPSVPYLADVRDGGGAAVPVGHLGIASATMILADFDASTLVYAIMANRAEVQLQRFRAGTFCSPPANRVQKLFRAPYAIGHWSNGYTRLECGQEATKVRVYLEDKLITRGRWADFWLPVRPDTVGVVPCTCVKDTVPSSERTCLSCHGTKFAPGFQRFLHQTQFWCSSEAANFTLTNTFVDRSTKKANIIALSPNTLTGTIITQEKGFTNPLLLDWSVKLDAFSRVAGNTFTLDYSVNGGAWTPVAVTTKYQSPISTTPMLSFGYTGTISGAALGTVGTIRFRVTLARATVADLSPTFEILRMRRVSSECQNPRLYNDRPDGQPGQILILRPQVQEQDSLDPMRGRFVEHLGDKAWTAPLDLFNLDIRRDTPEAMVDEYLGPHPFYRFSSGIQVNTLYVITRRVFNDGMGLFTQQWFDDRRAQDGEPYWLVW